MSSIPPRIGILALAAVAIVVSCTEPKKADNVASIDVQPKTARLSTVGDSQRFTAQVTTIVAGDTSPVTIDWTSRDPSLVSISRSGVATSLTKGGTTYIVASAGGKVDSAFVEVPLTPCGSTPATTLAVGQVVNDIGASGFCVAEVPDATYTVIAHNSSLVSSALAAIEVHGQGLGEPTFGARSLALRREFVRPTGLGTSSRLTRDWLRESARREAEKSALSPLVARAQQWYRSRATTADRSVAASAADTVGNVRTVNVSMSTGCLVSSRIDHTARVAAVSANAIILADRANPAGGFTDAEYASFATTFDTLVNPLDTQTFGTPTDLDHNGKVIILFTRAINELTPAGSETFEAGRTMSRDLFPTAFDGLHTACPASNVAEIFYMLVPDPNGIVNGNTDFTKDFVTSQTIVTITHEYQHMINISRRMYLLNLSSDKWIDEIWLQEGLSHTAEALLFHHASGLPPRSNIGLDLILSTGTAEAAFNTYMLGDFFLYDAFVDNIDATSPYHQSDDLQTRGATWSFLRYAADRIGATDGNLFFRLVNSGQIGLTNLETQLNLTPAALQTMIRDFAISVYADDFVPVTAIYTQPSWNMRSIYPGLNVANFTWPLSMPSVSDATPVASAIFGGGSAVYQFSTKPGSDAFIRATGTAGAALPATVTLSVIRTK